MQSEIGCYGDWIRGLKISWHEIHAASASAESKITDSGERTASVQTQVLQVTGFMTFGKLLNLSKPWFLPV